MTEIIFHTLTDSKYNNKMEELINIFATARENSSITEEEYRKMHRVINIKLISSDKAIVFYRFYDSITMDRPFYSMIYWSKMNNEWYAGKNCHYVKLRGTQKKKVCSQPFLHLEESELEKSCRHE